MRTTAESSWCWAGSATTTLSLVDANRCRNRCSRRASKGVSNTHSQGRLTRWGAWASAQALLTARPAAGPGRQSPSRGRGTPHTCARQWSEARRASRCSEGRPCQRCHMAQQRRAARWVRGGGGPGHRGAVGQRPGHAPMLTEPCAVCTVASQPAAGNQDSKLADVTCERLMHACHRETQLQLKQGPGAVRTLTCVGRCHRGT